MSDNKKYYYLKLKENFFDTDELRILESMPNGYMYSNLLLKLYLKSLKFEGKLQLNEYIPYNPQMIATVTNLNIDIVTAGLKILEQLKLIDVLPDGTIYMIQIQNYIGQSSTEADRKRNYRAKIENEKVNLLGEGQIEGQNEDKCPTEQDKNPPEIKKDTEKDTEKDIDIYKEEVNEVWNYYTGKLKVIGKSRKKTENKTKHIHARLKDNFTVDQLKQVMDNVFSNDFMLGNNEKNKMYIEIDNFMCNTEKIEKWLEHTPKIIKVANGNNEFDFGGL